MYDPAILAAELRHSVFSHPDDIDPRSDAVLQARTNRDLMHLMWCIGNFRPRWDGDDGRKLLPVRSAKLIPGFPHACWDADFVTATWPAAAIAAQQAFWDFIDAEYEVILAEVAAWASDLDAFVAAREAHIALLRDGIEDVALFADAVEAESKPQAATPDMDAAYLALDAATEVVARSERAHSAVTNHIAYVLEDGHAHRSSVYCDRVLAALARRKSEDA